jgi:glutaredoxin
MQLEPTATVYTREGCHLCQQAHDTLLRHGFRVQLVDIDQDPELKQRYTSCVPVVLIDGRERFRGRIDPRLLRRLTRQMEKR